MLRSEAKEAIPHLQKLPTDKVWYRIPAQALLLIDPQLPEAKAEFQRLVKDLKSKDPLENFQAIFVIEKLGELGKPAVPALIESLKVNDKYLNRKTSRTLARLGAKEAIPIFIDALQDKADPKSKLDKASAAEVLGQMGALAEEALPHLEGLSKNEDTEIRKAAMEAASQIKKALEQGK